MISAKRYLDEHYMRPILFQELADMFSISSGQLTRLFKKREGKSLQEYAIQKRLDAALRQLENTNANVKEIAIGCGFADEGNFFRIFKKHFKMTPIDYRKIKRLSMQESIIDNDYQRLYNEKGLDNLAKSQGDGEFTMFGPARSKQMILAAAMSLMLLLSACGTAPANTTNGAGAQNTPTPAATTQSPAAATKAEAAWPRTYVDARGEEVTIEIEPKRLAAVDWTITEKLMALDTPPIAADTVEIMTEWKSTKAYFEKYHVEELGVTNINIEKLIEMNPDLILAGIYNDEGVIENLEKIAPVVVVGSNMESDWQGGLREVAKIVGKEQAAETFIDAIVAQIQEVRDRLATVEKTVGFINVYEKTIAVFSASQLDMYYDASRGIGLSVPQGLPIKTGEISLEAFAEMNPDYIFYSSSGPYMDEISESSVWAALTAVQEGHVYPIHLSGLTGGPLSVKYGIQVVLDAMTE